VPVAETRLHSPAAERNRQPILAALRPHFPARGMVLEIASGSGQHACHFAPHLPQGATWQPSDPDADARASIAAWGRDTRNLALPALALDVTKAEWHQQVAALPVRLVVCINMIHIAPWAAAEGLFRGAAALDAPVFLYGPFKRGGRHTAPSNAAFDASLRAQDPAWGVRDLDDVAALAQGEGFAAPAVTEMPANNLSVYFARQSAGLR
jgi:hypothetical protein